MRLHSIFLLKEYDGLKRKRFLIIWVVMDGSRTGSQLCMTGIGLSFHLCLESQLSLVKIIPSSRQLQDEFCHFLPVNNSYSQLIYGGSWAFPRSRSNPNERTALTVCLWRVPCKKAKWNTKLEQSVRSETLKQIPKRRTFSDFLICSISSGSPTSGIASLDHRVMPTN